MRIRERVWIGLLVWVLLALLLTVFMNRLGGVMDERRYIDDYGYRYVGVGEVSREDFNAIVAYLDHFNDLGSIQRVEALGGGRFLAQYNFLSRQYYPELKQKGMAGSLEQAETIELVMRFWTLLVIPGFVCFLIVAGPWLFKEGKNWPEYLPPEEKET